MRLNSRGDWCAGVGSIAVSCNGQVLGHGGGAQFLFDTTVIYQDDSGTCRIVAQRIGEQPVVLAERGANTLVADGQGRWAAWLDHVGVFGSLGSLPQAGILDAGHGTIALCLDRQVGRGFVLYPCSGAVIARPDIEPTGFRVIGASSALWIGGGKLTGPVETFNAPAVSQLAPAWGACAVQVQGEWWIVYGTDEDGVVCHPFGSPCGYRLIPAGQSAYGLDVVAIGNVLVVRHSTTEGEAPGDVAVTRVDLTQPRADLRPVSVPVVGPVVPDQGAAVQEPPVISIPELPPVVVLPDPPVLPPVDNTPPQPIDQWAILRRWLWSLIGVKR